MASTAKGTCTMYKCLCVNAIVLAMPFIIRWEKPNVNALLRKTMVQKLQKLWFFIQKFS